MFDSATQSYELQNGSSEEPVLWLATMIARSCRDSRTTSSIIRNSQVLGDVRDDKGEEYELCLRREVLLLMLGSERGG